MEKIAFDYWTFSFFAFMCTAFASRGIHLVQSINTGKELYRGWGRRGVYQRGTFIGSDGHVEVMKLTAASIAIRENKLV
jgi:hypothetical protein